MAREKYNNEAFTEEYYNQYNSMISNGETRIPVCFCIDTSSSMNFITNKEGEYRIINNSSHMEDGIANVVNVEPMPGITLHHRIEEVQRVLNQMVERMKGDRRIANAVLVSVITFDLFADCIIEFSEVYKITQASIYNIRTHEDKTNASKGIYMALDRLDRFERVNSGAGNEAYKPVLVFMSDGDVNEDPNAIKAGNEIRKRSEEGKLKVIPISIGKNTNETWLRRLSQESHVYHMEYEEEFDRVFDIIMQRIDNTTVMISVDEGLQDSVVGDENNNFAKDESSSKYGMDISKDDFLDFLNNYANS